jgi:Lon protease-like protein
VTSTLAQEVRVPLRKLLRTLKRPRIETLPLFPLNTVLFPGGVLPLRVFEERYMEMTKACLRDSTLFGVCLIREGEEVGKPAVPESVGCAARITDWDMQQLGLLQIRAEGQYRFRILSTEDNGHGLLIARAEPIPAEEPAAVPAHLAACGNVLRAVVSDMGEKTFTQPLEFDNAVWLGYRLSELLPIKVAAKQRLLELTDPLARLEVLGDFMRSQKLIP